ncbi:MAG TPA: hypothetical protein VFG30_41405 [Polyangiales bacterium]|jgi:hypothetical protein|nr:hypothetical protein [Polyangiales bacterium]
MRSILSFTCCVIAFSVASAGVTHAYDSWFERIRPERPLSRLFPASESRAEVSDGFLLGTGSEIIRPLADGRLQIERTRIYTRVRDTETGRIAPLPEPWRARSVLTVLPSLRLIGVDTQLFFKRSGDTVFQGSRLSERHDWLFKVDRTRIAASADGKRLTLESYQARKRTKSETYDYPADAIPFEVVGMFLSVAVERQLDKFDFELLLPGGSTHGVRAETHRTRDLRHYAEGYRIPKSRLVAREPLALVDLKLASPVKYVFFPHHFYMAFSIGEPWKLTMLWGGDPDENLQAFRID